MRYKPLPPLEELKEFLDYNPDTGIFTWIKKTNRRIKVGQVTAITSANGYMRIMFKTIYYYAHRLAYYMYYGIDPLEKLVDHIDGDKANNKINNLRLATRSQNGMNRVSLAINNTSGATGVVWNKRKKKWAARITIDRFQKHLGLFASKEDAIKSRREAETKYYGDFRSRELEKEKSICWLGVIPEGMKDEMRYPTEEEIDKFLEEAENDEQTTN